MNRHLSAEFLASVERHLSRPSYGKLSSKTVISKKQETRLALARWFRYSLYWSSYDLRANIIPANFSKSNAWDSHLVVTEISGNVLVSSEDFRRISEEFQTLPKIECPQMFGRRLSTSEAA